MIRHSSFFVLFGALLLPVLIGVVFMKAEISPGLLRQAIQVNALNLAQSANRNQIDIQACYHDPGVIPLTQQPVTGNAGGGRFALLLKYCPWEGAVFGDVLYTDSATPLRSVCYYIQNEPNAIGKHGSFAIQCPMSLGEGHYLTTPFSPKAQVDGKGWQVCWIDASNPTELAVLPPDQQHTCTAFVQANMNGAY